MKRHSKYISSIMLIILASILIEGFITSEWKKLSYDEITEVTDSIVTFRERFHKYPTTRKVTGHAGRVSLSPTLTHYGQKLFFKSLKRMSRTTFAPIS